jgi:hypothetical protein
VQKVSGFWGFGGIWGFQNADDPIAELLADEQKNEPGVAAKAAARNVFMKKGVATKD